MSHVDIHRPPNKTEYAPFYAAYIGLAAEGNIVTQLETQITKFRTVMDAINEDIASVLHEPYTWTIKQVTGHLIDGERVFGYRALRFGSGDTRAIIGMEQNPWVENTDYQTPTLAELADEWEYSRRANLSFFRRLRPEAWDARGATDGNEMTVRALAYCLVGHVTHHLEIIKTRVA